MTKCPQGYYDVSVGFFICGGSRRVILCEPRGNIEPITYTVFDECQYCHWITATASETKVDCD